MPESTSPTLHEMRGALRPRAKRITALALVALACCAPASAIVGDSADWATADSGGGISTGAGFEVSGTIGQGDAVAIPASNGAGLQLTSGFWPGFQAGNANALFKDGFE